MIVIMKDWLGKYKSKFRSFSLLDTLFPANEKKLK